MNVQDLYERRNDFFLKPSSALRGGVVACLVLGLLSVGYGFVGVDPVRTWGAVLMNLFFFFAIALGGVSFSRMQDVIGAVWCRPIKRIHEGFSAFLPVACILFLIFFACIAFNIAGANEVYSWIKDPSIVAHFYGKNVWLTKNFMLIRDTGAVLLILAIYLWQMCQHTKRDRLFVEGKKEEAQAYAQKLHDKMRYWSAPILVVHALLFSLLGFDLLMTLEPLWFSTLWAGWLFSILMQTLMAATLIAMFVLKKTPIGQVYEQKHFHDIGKLMHGFTIFFAYLTYAHILTYWYGNVPEETEYFIHRLHAPWIWIVLIAPLFCFVLPLFALIFKAAKWTSMIAIPLSVIILIAQWFVYVLIVMPDMNDGKWNNPLIDVGILLGFLGMFLLCYLAFAKRHPMVALADTLLPEALQEDHH